MPNIRRTFPGDDIPEDPSQDEPMYRGTGKQLEGGKYLRSNGYDDEEEDSSDDEEEEPTYSGGGKQLRGAGGKYLRPSYEEEDDDMEEDSDEEVEVVQVQPRPGGKILSRPPPPDDEEESESEEEVQSDDEPVRVMHRGGGKSLSRPPTQQEESEQESEEEEEEDDSEEEDEPIRVVQGTGVNSIGKQLVRQVEHAEPAKTTISRAPSGGKQLRRAEPDDDDEESEPPKSIITRSPAGGKQLRRPELEEEEEEEKTPLPPIKESAKPQISRSPAGGKQLRRTPKEEEDSSEEDELFLDDDEEEEEQEEDYQEPPSTTTASRRSTRAAALNKKPVVEESDEELFGDDDADSSDEEQELDINNTEALIRDEEDRKYLDSLPEIERESILAERFEKLKNEQDLKRAVREAKRKEAEQAGQLPAKRRAPPAKKPPSKKAKTDGDDALAKKLAGRRESSRVKDAIGVKSKKAAALAALKKERTNQKQRVDDSEDSDLDFDDDSDDGSDDDYEEAGIKPWQKKTKSILSRIEQDDESLEEEEEQAKKGKPDRRTRIEKSGAPVAEAGLEDFQKITIPRRHLKRWCNEPYFEAAVIECFVRLFIGENPETGEKTYRLCEIVDVKDGIKTYKFPAGPKETPVSTNKLLTLRFGQNSKDFPMYLVSDAAPDLSDFQKYIGAQRSIRGEVLSKRRAAKLVRVRDNLIKNYRYTVEDIERNLQRRKEQGKSVGNLGLEVTKANIAVHAARNHVLEAEDRLNEVKKALIESHNDALGTERVEDAQKILDAAKKELEERLKDEQRAIRIDQERKQRLKERPKDKNWEKVNKRAVEMNQRADREAHKLQENQTIIGKKKEFDPYARRKVKPKILWEVGQDGNEGKTAEEKKEEAVSNQVNKESIENSSTPSLVQESNEKATALSESHQFVIDEEDLAQTSATSLLLGNTGPKKQRVRKGLSLNEYLEKKANGTI